MHLWQRAIVKIILCCLILFGLVKSWGPLVVAQQNRPDIDDQVDAIFNQLSPREKVGQLFIVTFNGTSAPPQSQISQLIRDHRVGGVWLQNKQ